VAGSSVYGAANPEEAIKALRAAVDAALLKAAALPAAA
jgi:hypothetical protein